MVRTPRRIAAFALPLLAAVEAQGQIAVDEIVVTGERGNRSLRETASSVLVLEEDLLQSLNGYDRIDDLLALSPNVSWFGGNSGPTFRGQDSTGVLDGGDAFVGGNRPRATIQVDGRPVSFNEYIYGLTTIWDVEQVEVFVGPQTTTQGVNSIGGAVYVDTKDPGDEFEIGARLLGGSDSTGQLSAVVSGPFSESFSGRLAVDHRQHDSYVRQPNAIVDVGEPQGEEQTTVTRAKLRFAPPSLPEFEAMLTLNANRVRAPQTEIVHAVDSLGLRFEDRTNVGTFIPQWNTDSDSAILRLSYDFGDSIVLSNTTSYTEVDIERLVPPGEGIAFVDGDELTNELLLSFDDGDRAWSGRVGLYYRDSRDDEQIDIGSGRFVDEKSSAAIFGEASYRLTERWTLTAGGRWQRDEQDRVGSLFLPVDFTNDEDEFLPKFTVRYDASDLLTVGATAARGYNPGGLTLSFNTGEQGEFDAESLWNYELFARGSNAEQTLFWQANLFYTDIEDAQRTTQAAIPVSPFVEERALNADEARSVGLEASLRYALNDRWALRGNVGWLDTELEEFSESLTPGVEGNEFGKAPSFTATAGVDWSPTERMRINLLARYSDDYYSDDENTAELRVDSYTVVDLRASYDWERTSIFAFATNLFDEFYVTEQLGGFQVDTDGDGAGDVDAGLAYVGNPREVGIGIRVSFQ